MKQVLEEMTKEGKKVDLSKNEEGCGKEKINLRSKLEVMGLKKQKNIDNTRGNF